MLLPLEGHIPENLFGLSLFLPEYREHYHFSRWQCGLLATVSSAHSVPEMTDDNIYFSMSVFLCTVNKELKKLCIMYVCVIDI